MVRLNKKGQYGMLGGLISAVGGLVVLGLLLVYTGDIVETERNNFDTNQVISMFNESVLLSGGGGTIKSGSLNSPGFSNFVVSLINNGTVLGGGNLTFATTNIHTFSNGSIAIKAGTVNPSSRLNLTYTFNADALTASVNASDDTLRALNNVSTRVDTLGTIIIIGGIISILIGVFGGFLIQRLAR